MEGLTTYFATLNDLRSLAMKLTTIVPSLTNIFDQEAISLNRKDQISRLRAIQSVITQQLDEVKRSEDVAGYGYSKARLKISLGELAIGSIIKMTSQDDRKLDVSNNMLQNLAGKQPPFGRVYISIGPEDFLMKWEWPPCPGWPGNRTGKSLRLFEDSVRKVISC